MTAHRSRPSAPDVGDQAAPAARTPTLLSDLLRYRVADADGRSARIRDLALDLREGDDLPVRWLIAEPATRGGEPRCVGGPCRIDARRREIRVTTLVPQRISPASLDAAVLARRDILDSLVLDLRGRRTTRVSDVVIEEREGTLVVDAVDIGIRALLRRACFGRVPIAPRPGDLLEWEYVEYLRGDPAAAWSAHDAHERIALLPPGEIAGLLDDLPYLHAAELIGLLPAAIAADTLEALPRERQLQVLDELPVGTARTLLALIAPEHAADLIGCLRPDEARGYLELVPQDARERIVELLRYPPDTVGGIMTNDVVIAPEGITVGAARQLLEQRAAMPDFAYFVYVVADETSRRLVGVVTLRELLVTPANRLVSDVMNAYLVALSPLEPAEAAARRLLATHLAALPVVGREGRLIGAVTVDAAVARVAPAPWRDRAPRVFS